MQIDRSLNRTIAFLLAVLGCAPGPADDEQPPPVRMPEIYKVIPTWCTGPCWSLTLYRSDTSIELRATEPDGSFLGLATGSLMEATSEELDQLLDGAVDLGEVPGDMSFDAPLVELWIPGLHLIYDQGHPPSGLVEIDAFLAVVLDDLSQCRATTKVVPDSDCEPLNWYPESAQSP